MRKLMMTIPFLFSLVACSFDPSGVPADDRPDAGSDTDAGDDTVPCETHADCEAIGLDCAADRCMGGFCRQYDECPDGQVCMAGQNGAADACSAAPDCLSDNDCDDDSACTDDYCVIGQCENRANCPSGESCEDDTCRPDGAECVYDADCTGGYACHDTYCFGNACEYHDTCPAGQACTATGCQATGTPGVILSTTAIAATEGGSTGSYTVRLATAPTSNVSITVTPNGQATASASTLTFTTANWSSPQTVTVTAVDDSAVEGAHTGTIVHGIGSADAAYSGLSVSSVTVNVTDNDVASTPGVTLSATSVAATEGGSTGSYTVRLNTAPTSNVTINITPDTQVSASASTLTFTTANWSSPQTVTVTAVDDSAVEGAHTGSIYHGMSSADATYNVLTVPGMTVNVTDNDVASVPGATFSATSVAATEGGSTGSYTVRLNTAPTSNVTVTLSSNAQVSASASTLTFTTANWSSPQTVTVTAVDDSAVEGSHTGTIGHVSSSSDVAYNGLSIPTVTVNVTDNDSAAAAPKVTCNPTTVGGAQKWELKVEGPNMESGFYGTASYTPSTSCWLQAGYSESATGASWPPYAASDSNLSRQWSTGSGPYYFYLDRNSSDSSVGNADEINFAIVCGGSAVYWFDVTQTSASGGDGTGSHYAVQNTGGATCQVLCSAGGSCAISTDAEY